MRGVILAGGLGTRLRPLTKMINKHLLPVGRYPMVYYAVEKLRSAGVNDILLITGKQSAGLYMEFLGSGEEWGVRLTYKLQEEAGGIAQALLLAEGFVQPGEKFVVLLGDNLFEDSLAPFINEFEHHQTGAKVLLKSVLDPRRFGVPVLQGQAIVKIEEKPERPSSSFCVTGIYFYDGRVFDIIRQIRPSARGELEITDVNNIYAAEGKLHYNVLSGWWCDAGTFESLYEAAARLRDYKSPKPDGMNA